MPCNSDYLNAIPREEHLSKVACLLDELDGKGAPDPTSGNWRGYHPAVYNQTSDTDALVRELCERLQKLDVTKYSLEMQTWWRDHQRADKTRVEHEMERIKLDSEKQAALAKLTPYERSLLGL